MSELRFDLGLFGRTSFDGLVIPAGTEQLISIVDEDQTFVLLLLKGRVSVSREDNRVDTGTKKGKKRKPKVRAVTGTPGSPVILTRPGTYRLFATQHCICLRAERS